MNGIGFHKKFLLRNGAQARGGLIRPFLGTQGFLSYFILVVAVISKFQVGYLDVARWLQ